MKKTAVIIIIFMFLAIVAIGIFWFMREKSISQPCTAEALMCPDGTSVGRTGPGCKFAPCPNDLNSLSAKQDDVTCRKYANVLSKYGEIKYGTVDAAGYRGFKGILCSVSAEQANIFYDSTIFQKNEQEIQEILESDDWQDTGTGGDRPGIGDFGSTSIYENNGSVLVFERGERGDKAKIQSCISNAGSSEDVDYLEKCIKKLKSTVYFAVMAGKTGE